MPSQSRSGSVQTLRRRCKYCRRPFVARRLDQLFGSGPEHRGCRQAWWRRRHLRGVLHRCPECGMWHGWLERGKEAT